MAGSWIFVENKGLKLAYLPRILAKFNQKEQQKADGFWQMLRGIMGEEQLAQAAAERSAMERIIGGAVQAPKTALAWSDEASWLPLFIESLCDGNVVSSADLRLISREFGAAVLAFAVMDSDALFVSFCDEANGIYEDYIKPNFAEYEEYDREVYRCAYPERLQEIGGDPVQLRRIWQADDYVFAEDRLDDMAALLGLNMECDFIEEMDGYKLVAMN